MRNVWIVCFNFFFTDSRLARKKQQPGKGSDCGWKSPTISRQQYRSHHYSRTPVQSFRLEGWSSLWWISLLCCFIIHLAARTYCTPCGKANPMGLCPMTVKICFKNSKETEGGVASSGYRCKYSYAFGQVKDSGNSYTFIHCEKSWGKRHIRTYTRNVGVKTGDMDPLETVNRHIGIDFFKFFTLNTESFAYKWISEDR